MKRKQKELIFHNLFLLDVEECFVAKSLSLYKGRQLRWIISCLMNYGTKVAKKYLFSRFNQQKEYNHYKMKRKNKFKRQKSYSHKMKWFSSKMKTKRNQKSRKYLLKTWIQELLKHFSAVYSSRWKMNTCQWSHQTFLRTILQNTPVTSSNLILNSLHSKKLENCLKSWPKKEL